MSDSKKKPERRDFLFTATYAVGAVGAAAVVWPMIDQMNPDASVKALASTEVDVSSVQPGNTITVLWRGKPVFIRRRTQEEIDEWMSANAPRERAPEPTPTPEPVVEASDDSDDLSSMSKDELEAWAREHLDVELDKRKTKKALLAEIEEHRNG